MYPHTQYTQVDTCPFQNELRHKRYANHGDIFRKREVDLNELKSPIKDSVGEPESQCGRYEACG